MKTHLEKISEYAAHRPEVSLPVEGVFFELFRLSGTERLSGNYEFVIDVHALDSRDLTPDLLSAEQLIGQPASVTFTPRDLAPEAGRSFHGLIREFSTLPLEQSRGRRLFRLHLVPFLTLSDSTINYRIYESVAIPDIVNDLASHWQVTPVNLLSGDHPQHHYRCQFEESDYNFLARQFEAEGIFYYFRHQEQSHTWVIADSTTGFDELDPVKIVYGSGATDWRTDYQLHAGLQRVCGYDIQTAEPFAEDESTVIELGNNGQLEVTRQLTGVKNSQEAEAAARIEMQRGEGRHVTHHGKSVRSDLAPGFTFQLDRHPDAILNEKYLLISVSHAYDLERGYRNAFSCVPVRPEISYRPPRNSARPAIRGPQTALVVEEPPDPDNLGAVQIEFPWFVEGKARCWVRFAEMAAGSSQRGTWFPPRVDDEVMVEFLNGDPDRPVITGRLYNGVNAPVEEEAGVTAIHTASGQYLRFDDQSNAERVELHGLKDIIVDNGVGTKITITAMGNIEIQSIASVKVEAAQIELQCGMLQVNSGFTKVSGVVQCDTLITNAVVSPTYTPGAGNIW